MAMRVTDSMISQTSIRNVNTNKNRLNVLQTQYTTGKRISRPSDDPIIAMRALRLRSTSNQITQYVDRNLPDAQSWLELTEDTLDSVGNMMQYMYSELVQAASDQEALDRAKLIESLESYKNSIYSEANADYAGRTLFSGYRTDSDVTFPKDSSDTRYQITENLSATDIKSKIYIANKTTIDTNNLGVVTNANLPTDLTVSSIRLSYDQLENSATDDGEAKAINSIEYKKVADIAATRKVEDGKNIVDINGGAGKITIQNNSDGTTSVTITAGAATNEYTLDKAGRFVEDSGNSDSISARINSEGNLIVEFTDSDLAKSSNKGLNLANNTLTAKSTKLTITTALNGVIVGDLEASYELKIDNYCDGSDAGELDTVYKDMVTANEKKEGKITFLTETGELLISDVVRSELEGLLTVNGKEPISVTYRKSGFEQYDVRPEQLFDCVDMTKPDSEDWQEYYFEQDKIEYTVATNQTIHINTTASEVFQMDLARDIDNLIRALQENLSADQKVTDIKSMLEDARYADDASQNALNSMLDAAEKETSAAKNVLQTLLGNSITSIKSYMTDVSAKLANVGNRLAQVKVITTRMTDQKNNVESLQSTNEDKDLEEIMTEYTSALTAYEASLTAVGKISQVSLLDYI